MLKVTKYVLDGLFDQYNKLYFDDMLVKPILSTYIGVNTMGIFNVSRKQDKIKTKIMIAKNVKYTEEDLTNVLVHEMIHLYVYQQIGPGHGHDKIFVKKMKELNEKYGLDIRKNCKHLGHKMVRKSKGSKKSGWLYKLKIFFGY